MFPDGRGDASDKRVKRGGGRRHSKVVVVSVSSQPSSKSNLPLAQPF